MFLVRKRALFLSWNIPDFDHVLRSWAGPSLAETHDTTIKTVPYFDIPKRYFQAHFQIVDCDIFKTEMLHTGVNGVFYNLNKCVLCKGSAKLALRRWMVGFACSEQFRQETGSESRFGCCKFLDLCKVFVSHEPSSGANRQNLE